MGQSIPRQNPAVVLRSHINELRALLAIALVAVAGLTVAVVILANDSDEVSTTSTAVPAESAGSARFQAESVDRTFHQPGVRYDGDPDIYGPPSTRYEGDPGIFGPPSTRYDGDPGILPAPPPSEGSATEMKDGAGTAGAIGQSSGGTEFRGSKASEDGTPRFARPGSETEFRGSKASEDGTPQFARPGSETEFRGSKASEDGTPRFARPGSETDPHGPASALP